MNNAILGKLTGVLFIVRPIAFYASRQAGCQSRKSGGERS
jgi:hypothetical protein